MLQTIFGVICWITLAVQIGRVIETSANRLVAQVLVFLIALTAPVLQWNRIVLSESITISLTVLVCAAWLAFARRMDGRSVAGLLVATLLWTFTRQVQTFVVAALVVPMAILAWRRPRTVRRGGDRRDRWNRNYLDLGCGDFAPDVEDAHRSAGRWHRAVPPDRRPWEMTFFATTACRIPCPSNGSRSGPGQPVNVTQFGDPFAEYRLVDDPRFSRWVDQDADHVLIEYMISHPWQTLSDPLIHAPQLLTMNPDSSRTPRALPQWASTVVYGDLSSVIAGNSPAGPPRSSDPIYVVVLHAIGTALFVITALRRRLSRTTWVAVGALGFAACVGRRNLESRSNRFPPYLLADRCALPRRDRCGRSRALWMRSSQAHGGKWPRVVPMRECHECNCVKGSANQGDTENTRR